MTGLCFSGGGPRFLTPGLIASIFLSVSGVFGADSLSVSERDFSVSHDVDVLVVGGTSGGVAAAVEAAKAGSRVFLMAQRPYLGEDICGTYRMWGGSSEAPLSGLAADVFQPPLFLEDKALSYEYKSDVPAEHPHKDTATRPKLTDGKIHDLRKDTVQYGGSIELIATLPGVQQVDRVDVHVFQSPGSFATRSVTVYVSDDKRDWEKVGYELDRKLAKGEKKFSVEVDQKVRFIKLSVEQADNVKRMLLTEVEISRTAERTLKPGEQYPPTPLHVKRTFDNALMDAGVEFLYSCYPTDVLVDSEGRVGGVIMANRAGRQVVRAKTVIDATPNAMLSRIAGIPFRADAGEHRFQHTIVSEEPKAAQGVTVETSTTDVYHLGKEVPGHVYTVPLQTGPLDMHSYAEAQQQVLDKVWTAGQNAASEYIFEVPTTSIISLKRYDGSGSAGQEIPETAFQSPELSGAYVLSGHADVSRECAADLVNPVNYMNVGAQVGRWAAQAAQQSSIEGTLSVLNRSAGVSTAGELKETLAPIRPEFPVQQQVTIGATSYPVLGEYDVVVVGGGTSGGPAAIGAARQGAKTLVIEYQHGFGGVGTVGMIARYWKGYREGFTKEMDVGVRELRSLYAPPINGWDIFDKMEWYRREMRDAGAEMWMRSMAWGAVVSDGNVQGVAVSTPFGSGIVLAKIVIDSTGNGDIAIAAGADYEYYGSSRISIQGTGLPPFNLGEAYNNSDFTVSYESDVVDAWQLRVFGKSKSRAGDAYDVSNLIDSRERRRVLGDFYLTVMDQLMQRTYPDTIYKAYSDYDCHGVNYNKYIFLQPNPSAFSCYVPYRCLLPKGLEGILTTGMGISVHSDALPLIRMQPDLQNQGYAAGVAAAIAANKGVGPRQIDIKKLQRHLVDIGNLPDEVLAEKDFYPLSEARVKKAVENALEEYGGRVGEEISIVFSHETIALPLLRDAYHASEGKKKLFYAHILAVMEDPTGLETLINYTNGRRWDKGHPRPTAKMSDVDRLIISIALPKDPQATSTVVQKMARMNAAFDYSHFRAVAIALDQLQDPAAAPALAALLKKRGMTGYSVHSVEDMVKQDQAALKKLGVDAGTKFSFETREFSMRELALARALYRCGDHEGVGQKILEEYSTDLRGILAAHAHAVLNER